MDENQNYQNENPGGQEGAAQNQNPGGGYQQDYQNQNPGGGYQQDYQNGNPNGGYQQNDPNYQNYQNPGGGYDYHYSNGGYYGGYEPPKKTSTGFAVASLVLGIISVVLMCGPNLLTGALGIIFGAIYLAKGEREKRNMALAGLILSIIGVVLFVVVIGVSVLRISSLYDSYYNYF